VSFLINDGDDNSKTVSRDINFTAVNDAPTTTPIVFTAIVEDSAPLLITQAELLANANDIESDGLTATGLKINTGNGALIDNGDGSWSYTPASNDDTEVSFDFIITDGTDDVDETATLEITPVNDTPTTAPITLTSIAEDNDARLITQAELLANASDIEDDGLTATGLTIDPGGNGTLTDNGDGTWNYTPDPDFDTAVSLSYTITDGTDDVAGTATLEIASVNDAPTIPSLEASPLLFTEGDAPLITTVGIDIDDIDSPNLESATISISNNFVAGEDELTFDNAALNSLGINASFDDSTGILSLTGIASSDNYQQAIRSISYVNDSENPSDLTREISYTINDGIDSTTRTRTLEVAPVNDAPVIADSVLPPQAEDTNTTTPMRISDLFAAVYSDVDGTPAISGIAVTDNPATTDQGSWQYSLNASDWFNIDSVGETTALLLDRDTFIRFTPAADFHGNPAVLSIRAVDGTFTGDFSTDTANRLLLDTVTAGNMVSAEHAIAITILPVNDAPQGEDNRIDIPEDTPYSYSAADFGFSDLADGDSFRGVTVITLPANGTLSLNGTPVNANDWIPVTDLDIGILTYTPEAQDNREDSWSFAVSDDGGRVNNGEDQDQSDNTITMNIMPVNDAPAGRNDIIELNEDNTLILDASTFGFSDDSDGHSLAGVIITAPSAQGSLLHNGSAVSNNAFINTSDLEAGFLTYTPEPNEFGTNYTEILFKVVDTGPADIGENTSTENTLTINVNPVNDTPTLSIEDNLQVEENSSMTIASK